MLAFIVVSWIPLGVVLLAGVGAKSIFTTFGIGAVMTLIFGTILLNEHDREKRKT